jgi:hypothetical protein
MSPDNDLIRQSELADHFGRARAMINPRKIAARLIIPTKSLT